MCLSVCLSVCLCLIQATINAAAPPHIRKLSAVLLRRILIQDENSAYSQLSETR